MLARVSGGNSGIAEYLESGMKNGRDFTRDELDNRQVIEGDLSLTNDIINSIEDKGQDRYLHITLSFREDFVAEETLKAVVEDYKSMLLTAYKDDEFNFYAEAHLPKIKAIQDRKTGEMVDRKPHIHLVIPKTNLLNGNSLNPVGLYDKNVKYFEAIQEKINSKYNLESPKDFIRQNDDHQSEIVSRIKGDFFNEKQGLVKKDILYKVQSENITSMDEFRSVVETYGQVVTRNAGKKNEYIAVKIGDDKKFTNLKSPVFSKEYIERRELKLDRPSPKQIETRLETWQSIASREIKFVANATPKFREAYRISSNEEKRELLNNREAAYEQRYRNKHLQKSGGRERNNQSSINRITRANISRYSHGLPSMPERNVVYGVRGKEYASEQTERVLHDHEVSDMANRRQEKYQRPELRRFDNDQRTGGLNTANLESQVYRKEIEANIANAERGHFSDIRKNLEPARLLNTLSVSHGLNPDNHSISFAKDGSARIGTGKLNLNVSDFLTKHMNMPWSEAKEILNKCYQEQKDQQPVHDKVKHDPEQWKLYTKEYRPRFNEEIKSMRSELRATISSLKSNSFKEYQHDRSRIYETIKTPLDRKAALSMLLVERLKRDELIKEYRERTQNTISAIYRRPEAEKYNDYIHSKGENMGIADSLKKHIPWKEEENSIVKGDMQINIEDNIKNIEKEDKFLKEKAEKLRMNDLVASKKSKGIVHYKSQKDGSLVFEDRGDRIIFSRKELEKEKIALGLEVATAKYGNELKLTGNEQFKKMVVEVAAEKGLNIILKPEKYQEMLVQMKAELAAQKETEKDNPENSVAPEELAIAKGNMAEQQPVASSEESSPASAENEATEATPASAENEATEVTTASAENESTEAEPDLEQEAFLRDEERELAYVEIKQTVAKEMYGQQDSALSDQQIAAVEKEAQQILNARVVEKGISEIEAYYEIGREKFSTYDGQMVTSAEVISDGAGKYNVALINEETGGRPELIANIKVSDEQLKHITGKDFAELTSTQDDLIEVGIPSGTHIDSKMLDKVLINEASEDIPDSRPMNDSTVEKSPLVIEYSYTGEGNKFVMSIDGKPAADVIKQQPEVIDALSKNSYLKQFSREELASGVIDETGKGRALDDVIDHEGNSVKAELEANNQASNQKEQQQDKGMEM